jgi:D-sedoheptulose 7-phosphate isomerase
MQHAIQKHIQKTQTVIQKILEDELLLSNVEKIARTCVTALRSGHKILFVGNGGSAADSQHLAAELVSRLGYDRPAMAAIALTTDTSALTAIGNDYAFETIFSRQIEALGQPGDVLIAISTSGKSKNILKALETARTKKIVTVGFTGKAAPLMEEHCDLLLTVPSVETPKIQEGHIVLGHIICTLIEEDIYGVDYNPKVLQIRHPEGEIVS